MSADSTVICVGVDVSKQWVDFCLGDGSAGRSGRRPRRAAELNALAAELAAAQPDLVVIEATGGYELAVWAAFEAAGLAVAVVNPRRVRELARSLGVAAKTDRIDAAILARFGALVRPHATPLPTDKERELRDLYRRLGELVTARATERVRVQHERSQVSQASVKRSITWHCKEIATLEKALDKRLQASPTANERAQQLRSAPGVGPKTALALIVELPELGTLSGKQVASLAGLAPVARDSGRFRGRRMIAGGRTRLRQALYMAARSAIRCDAHLRTFRERLLAAGKPKQLVLIAVARKLLVALNAMVRDQTTWIPLNS